VILQIIKRILQEPLFHFFILGGLIFLLSGLFGNKDYIPQNNVVLVSAVTIDNYTKQWSAQMGRPATEEEISGFIEKYIREEILSREAITLGLDKGDIVIKRRLVQKIDFMSGEMLEVPQPTEEELTNYFEVNRSNYRLPRRISFTQVFLNIEGLPNDEAYAKATELKNQLSDVDPGNAFQYGSSTLLEDSYDNVSDEELSKLFGDTEFFKILWEFPGYSWQGPVESVFGLHLVYVSDKTDMRIPELTDIKMEVLRDLISDKQREIKQQFIESLKKRYIIKIDDELLPYVNEDD
jgi:hypothetical protein